MEEVHDGRKVVFNGVRKNDVETAHGTLGGVTSS
jgi:hypothetical protein